MYSRWFFTEVDYVQKEPKIAIISIFQPFECFNIIAVNVIVQSYKFLA